MEVNRYPALAAFIIRLVAVAMFVVGVGTLIYWFLILPQLVSSETNMTNIAFNAQSSLWQVGLVNGVSYLVGGALLYALSQPLGKLIGYRL